MNLPPLPTVIEGFSAPIKVSRPRKIVGGSEGLWVPYTRTILVRAGLPREYAWLTFLHELLHATEHDAGFALPEDERSSTHDALASGLMRVVRYLVDTTSPRKTPPAPTPRKRTKSPKPRATKATSKRATKGRT